MKRRNGLLFFCLIVIALLFPNAVSASCDVTTIGNTSIASSICNINSNTIEGVDSAATEDSTTNTAQLRIIDTSITINSNATLIAGTISLEGSSSVSILASGATIKTGGVWTLDSDADGWVSSPIQLFSEAGVNRRRLGRMRSTVALDCDDGSASVDNSCCTIATRYRDADGDGYGNPSISIQACTTSGYVSNGSDCDDGDPNVYPGTTYCP